jgi:hypothetical protein
VTGAGSAIIASSWPHQAGFPFKATICALSRSRAPGGQFVLHAKALPGNPYDGHTLGAVIEATERRDTADDTANFLATRRLNASRADASPGENTNELSATQSPLNSRRFSKEGNVSHAMVRQKESRP